MDYSNLFVCLMGIGTVFFGLICIILLVTLMSFVCRKTEQKTTLAPVSAPAGVPKAGIGPELIAAVSASGEKSERKKRAERKSDYFFHYIYLLSFIQYILF